MITDKEKKVFLAIPLNQWAIALKFDDPGEWEFNSSWQISHIAKEIMEHMGEEIEEGETDIPPEVWADFQAEFGLRPEVDAESFMQDILWTMESGELGAYYRIWENAVEAATEKLLTHIGAANWSTSEFTGDCQWPPMPIEENFPELSWAIEEGELRFFGSDAPFCFLVMAAMNGFDSRRFSGIREMKDTYSVTHWGKEPEKGSGWGLWGWLPELDSIFGIELNTDVDYRHAVSPSLYLKNEVATLKGNPVYSDWFI